MRGLVGGDELSSPGCDWLIMTNDWLHLIDLNMMGRSSARTRSAATLLGRACGWWYSWNRCLLIVLQYGFLNIYSNFKSGMYYIIWFFFPVTISKADFISSFSPFIPEDSTGVYILPPPPHWDSSFWFFFPSVHYYIYMPNICNFNFLGILIRFLM